MQIFGYASMKVGMYVDRGQEYDMLWNREAERLTGVEKYLD